MPELADGFRVITPDSRGHGRSTNPAGELSYALIADDLAALIAALGLRRPAVGGWSDGGQVTLELAARHPGAAGALIVGAAYPDFDSGGLREAHRALLGADEAGTPDPERSTPSSASPRRRSRPCIRAEPSSGGHWCAIPPRCGSTTRAFGRTSSQAIQTPILVLAGDRDELIPLDLSLALYRALPNAELAICPQLSHDGPTPERARSSRA